MTEGNVHTVHRDGKWLNEVEGGKRASNSSATRVEAIAKGREMARSRKVEHLVHTLDGRVEPRTTEHGLTSQTHGAPSEVERSFVARSDSETVSGAVKQVASGSENVLIVGASSASAHLLQALADKLNSEPERIERLIENMMTTPGATISTAARDQAHRNAQARARFLADNEMLTSGDVAELTGSRAANRSATATRLLNAGKIFAVKHEGQRLFPAVQFDADGHPRAVIADILRNLQPLGLTGWQTALWFDTRTGWLDHGVRPLDLLDEAPDEVVAAAAHETEPFPG